MTISKSIEITTKLADGIRQMGRLSLAIERQTRGMNLNHQYRYRAGAPVKERVIRLETTDPRQFIQMDALFVSVRGILEDFDNVFVVKLMATNLIEMNDHGRKYAPSTNH